ncbi:MAG: hypothetical protein WC788_03930 [Candidatus Paceibacterota bacterium]|jgi:hypothetical protein
MNLKIILVSPRQIDWAKNIDKKFLKNYGTIEIIPMSEKVKIGQNDIDFFKDMGIMAGPYRNFGIEQSIRQELSPIPVNIIRHYLSKACSNDEVKKYITFCGVNMLAATANDMYESYYWDMLLFTQRLSHLISQEKPLEILIYGPSSSAFFTPERPDVTLLFDNEFLYAPLAKDVCSRLNIKFTVIPRPIFLFSPFKMMARNFLFSLVKFSKILGRHLLARLPIYRKTVIKSDNKNIVAVIVRADPEYYAVKPLITEMAKDPSIRTVILQGDMLLQPQSWKTLRNYGEEFISLYSLTSFWDCIKCFADSFIRQLKFKLILKKIDLGEFNPGRSDKEKLCGDLLDKGYVIKEVFGGLSGVWPETMIFIKELDKFIAKTKPKAIISMGMIDHWVAVTSMLSNRYSIPTVSIQTTAMETHALPSPIYANRFLVYGEDMRNGLIKNGADPEKISATGAPKYDNYGKYSQEAKQQIRAKTRSKLGIPDSARILLVTTQATDFTSKPLNDELISLAIDFAGSNPDIYVIVKLHPRDPLEDYVAWQDTIKKDRINAQIIQKIDVIDLMLISETLLSRCSTTILDALTLGVLPIVLLDSYALSWVAELDYMRTDATMKVNTKKELLDAFNKAFFDDPFQKDYMHKRDIFINESIGKIDGHAAERMIEVIKSQIKA